MFNFHSRSIKACLTEVKSSEKGLTNEEANSRLKKLGENKLSEEKPLGKFVIFLQQFKSPLIYILLIAGFISLVLGEVVDAGVILGAVFLNAIIGYIQENKANDALKKLKEMVAHKALVIRDGLEIEIESKELVVGDIIFIEAGNRVSADARLIEANELKVNESNLTGESVPANKISEKVDKGASIADRKNMVYASTVAVSGKGIAVVTAIGKETEIGKISELVSSTKEEKTPLQVRLDNFSKFLGIMFVVICGSVLIIGTIQGRPFFDMFLVSVALAVAAIPEGLVISVTFILVLGMQQILKKKSLIRKLVATETLGSTTVICSDKTGTLTEGKMTAVSVIIGDKDYKIGSLGLKDKDKDNGSDIAELALKIGMMCNNAVVENPNDSLKDWRFLGMPTEVALLAAAFYSNLDKDKLIKDEPQIDELQFSSATKFMATLHKKGENSFTLYEKGAPEMLLKKSEDFYQDGKVVKITDENIKKLNDHYESLTKKGLRVIGVAIRTIDDLDWDAESEEKNWKDLDSKLTFVGFIALKDKLRVDAKETIKQAKKAGMRTVMITGDHKLTAMAIANEIGLKVTLKEVLTGEELDNIDDLKLKKIVNKIGVYARVSPHHKLRIIKAFQERGEVVAMTGDGVNDAPALKAADIGIALGTGTDIAKETSDMILLDNNFKTIVGAIKQGRIIFSNLQKVVTYLISDSFSEIILVTGSIILNVPLAILPVQILWINIVNDGLPHFSLAFEEGAKNIMGRKPMKRNEPIVNKEMKVIIFGVGIVRDLIILGVFIWMFKQGGDIHYLRTLFFTTLGFKSLVSIFSLRSFSQHIWEINPFQNLYLVGAVGISMSLLLLAVYFPPLQVILSTTALDWNAWMWIFSFGLLSIVLTEIVKFYFKITKK